MYIIYIISSQWPKFPGGPSSQVPKFPVAQLPRWPKFPGGPSSQVAQVPGGPSSQVAQVPRCPSSQWPKFPVAQVPRGPKFPGAQVPGGPSSQWPKFPVAEVPGGPKCRGPSSRGQLKTIKQSSFLPCIASKWFHFFFSVSSSHSSYSFLAPLVKMHRKTRIERAHRLRSTTWTGTPKIQGGTAFVAPSVRVISRVRKMVSKSPKAAST